MQVAAPDKTSSLESLGFEKDPILKRKMDEETTEWKTCKVGAPRTRYDVEYWMRVMKTGCMIMVFLSVVSPIGIQRVCHIIILLRYLII